MRAVVPGAERGPRDRWQRPCSWGASRDGAAGACREGSRTAPQPKIEQGRLTLQEYLSNTESVKARFLFHSERRKLARRSAPKVTFAVPGARWTVRSLDWRSRAETEALQPAGTPSIAATGKEADSKKGGKRTERTRNKHLRPWVLTLPMTKAYLMTSTGESESASIELSYERKQLDGLVSRCASGGWPARISGRPGGRVGLGSRIHSRGRWLLAGNFSGTARAVSRTKNRVVGEMTGCKSGVPGGAV